MVGPSVLGIAAAGKRLTGPERHVGRLRRDHLPLPVVSLQRGGRRLPLVHGATSPTYSLGNRDIGKTLGLTVYATDSTGTVVRLLEPDRPDRAVAGRCSSRPPSRSSPGLRPSGR